VVALGLVGAGRGRADPRAPEGFGRGCVGVSGSVPGCGAGSEGLRGAGAAAAAGSRGDPSSP